MYEREISTFLAKELLYDYATHSLDFIRKDAFEKQIKVDTVLAEELAALRAGQSYAMELQNLKIAIPKEQVEKVKNKKSFIRYKNLPQPVRWGAEALVLAGLAVLSIHIFPWEMLKSVVQQAQTPVVNSHPTNSTLAAPATTDKTVVANSNTDGEEEEIDPEQIEKDDEKSIEKPSAKAQVASVTSATTVGNKKEKVAPQGEVLRINFIYSNVDKVAAEIAQKIRALGGSRAGSVELGWRKPNGSYYHFQMPQKNYNELISFLSKFAKVKVSRGPHPRVMPKGIFRMILWMEQSQDARPDGSEQNSSGGASYINSPDNLDEPTNLTAPSETSQKLDTQIAPDTGAKPSPKVNEKNKSDLPDSSSDDGGANNE